MDSSDSFSSLRALRAAGVKKQQTAKTDHCINIQNKTDSHSVMKQKTCVNIGSPLSFNNTLNHNKTKINKSVKLETQTNMLMKPMNLFLS